MVLFADQLSVVKSLVRTRKCMCFILLYLLSVVALGNKTTVAVKIGFTTNLFPASRYLCITAICEAFKLASCNKVPENKTSGLNSKIQRNVVMV